MHRIVGLRRKSYFLFFLNASPIASVSGMPQPNGHGARERKLTDIFTAGNVPACDVAMGEPDGPDGQLWIALREGRSGVSPCPAAPK